MRLTVELGAEKSMAAGSRTSPLFLNRLKSTAARGAGSLVKAMCQRELLSQQAFWDYCNSPITLTAAQNLERLLRRKQAEMVFSSYSEGSLGKSSAAGRKKSSQSDLTPL